METFSGKVAVITGGASGIGRALAHRAAQEKMKVVLADIDRDALAQVQLELQTLGADVLAVPTNVAKAEDVQHLAQATTSAFGEVHLLCNNAGVYTNTRVWENTLNDWKWVIDVNLWGVIHGLWAFLPMMLAHDSEAHIVNTASTAGLVGGMAHRASYAATKRAIVSLSESLFHELTSAGAKVGVSVLCPGPVKTRIVETERARPPELHRDESARSVTPEMSRKYLEAKDIERKVLEESGMAPERVAEMVFNGIRTGQFYILTHGLAKLGVHLWADDVLWERDPTDPKAIRSKSKVLWLLLKNLLPLPRPGILLAKGARGGL